MSRSFRIKRTSDGAIRKRRSVFIRKLLLTTAGNAEASTDASEFRLDDLPPRANVYRKLIGFQKKSESESTHTSSHTFMIAADPS